VCVLLEVKRLPRTRAVRPLPPYTVLARILHSEEAGMSDPYAVTNEPSHHAYPHDGSDYMAQVPCLFYALLAAYHGNGYYVEQTGK